jgi:cyclic lactone autoinducer peptide
MGKLFSAILAALGIGAAGIGSQACMIWYVDEPEAPASLIK